MRVQLQELEENYKSNLATDSKIRGSAELGFDET